MSNHTTDDAVYEIALLKESVKLSDKNNWLVVTTERMTKKQSTKIRLPPSANSIASVATDTRGVILTTAVPHGLFVRSANKGKDVWRAAYSGDVFVEPGTRLPTNLVYVNWGRALQKAMAARLAWPGYALSMEITASL